MIKRFWARYPRLREFDIGFLWVIGIAFIAIWPFISRNSLPAETDAELHIFRLHELTLLIQGGEVYPRWAPNFYHGYGYPIFNYYAPLSYYMGLFSTMWAPFDAVDGVKFVFVLGLLLAGFGTYGFVRDNWGREAGLIATAVYLYAPYIQYIDPHARGVLAESFSFGVFPLALWALDRFMQTRSRRSLLTAVPLISATIMSHNLMGLLFFGILASWVMWHLIFKQHASKDWQPFVVLILGLCGASFFWLPVFLERDAVNLNTLLGQGDNFDFRTHFLSLRDLLAPSIRLDWGATEPNFRFNLGVAQWVLGLTGLVGLGIGSWQKRAKETAPIRVIPKSSFFILSFFFLIFLMMPLSEPIWELIPALPFFQFPWRFMGAAALMLSIVAGVGITTLLRWTTFFQWGTAVVLLLPIMFGLVLSQPNPWPDFGEVNTLRMSLIEHEGRWLGTTSTADFVPATVDTIPERNGNVVAGIYNGEPLDRVNRATLPEGATVEGEEIRPLHLRYQMSTPKDSRLRLFLFDFPGWQVKIDGEVVETELGRPEGFLIVPVPVGTHTIDVQFGSTPARRLGFFLSWGALLLTAVWAVMIASPLGSLINDDRHRVNLSEVKLEGQNHPHIIGLSLLVFNLVFVFILNPSGVLRYDSTGLVAEPAQMQVQHNFGDQVMLIGIDGGRETAVSPGTQLPMTLYWKALREMDINYQIFVHVLKPDGTLLSQSDKLNPGEFPTKRWPLDKYVRDEHLLVIPADAPPGKYTVSVGLWVQSEGWRLPIFDSAGQQVGDSQPLFEITVK